MCGASQAHKPIFLSRHDPGTERFQADAKPRRPDVGIPGNVCFEKLYQSLKGGILSCEPRELLKRLDGSIEDEQCQRIDGGYEAAKFRFLLFL